MTKKLTQNQITVADLAPHIHSFLPNENKVEKLTKWLINWIDLSLECGKIKPYDFLPSKMDLWNVDIPADVVVLKKDNPGMVIAYPVSDEPVVIVEDKEKATRIFRCLSLKFTSDVGYIDSEIEKFAKNTICYELKPEHITGKIVNES